jgi:hypothetical protein
MVVWEGLEPVAINSEECIGCEKPNRVSSTSDVSSLGDTGRGNRVFVKVIHEPRPVPAARGPAAHPEHGDYWSVRVEVNEAAATVIMPSDQRRPAVHTKRAVRS